MTAYAEKKARLLRIVDGALQAVAPDPALRAAVKREGNILAVDGREYDLNDYDRVLLLGAGKASAAMAATLEDILGDRLHSGLVATKYGHGLDLARTEVMESGHPVPDEAGVRAAAALLERAADAGERDLVLFLLSGGASALVPSPLGAVSLADKQEATRRLLECGAAIGEINAIRKHLSRFKGGHLAETLAPATVATLIISDVVGDRLDVIGSGPTAPDDSTFLDCQTILDRYRLCDCMPDSVVRAVADGCAGQASETRKAGDPCFARVRNTIVAGNAMAVHGAAGVARDLGYTPVVVDLAMEGEARDRAVQLIRLAGKYSLGGGDAQPPVCLLAGGETTVTIKGSGKGGRNQEWALAAALEMTALGTASANLSAMSLGTDGSDGPTDAAGGMAFPDTASGERSEAAGRALADNDAYHFLDGVGTLLKTGPTRTNVMDVAAVLVDPV
jgi:hydroxypyruvate reductase